MSKLKPQAPLKKDWNKDADEFQGKRSDQVQDSNSFAVFAIICLLITLIVSITHEIYIWLK